MTALPMIDRSDLADSWHSFVVRPAVDSRPSILPRRADTRTAAPSQRPLDLEFEELIGLPDPRGMRTVRNTGDWQATPLPGLPDALRWSTSLTQAIVETLSGRRSTSQLNRWVSDEVLRLIAVRARLRSHPRAAYDSPVMERCMSVTVQHPAPSVAEVAAVISQPERSVPMALRLEARKNRWLCTAIELPVLIPGATASSVQA